MAKYRRWMRSALGSLACRPFMTLCLMLDVYARLTLPCPSLELPGFALNVVLTLCRKIVLRTTVVNGNSGTGHDNEVAVSVLLTRCAAQKPEQKLFTGSISRRHRRTQRCMLLVPLVFASGVHMVRFLLLDMFSPQSLDECFVCIAQLERRRRVSEP